MEPKHTHKSNFSPVGAVLLHIGAFVAGAVTLCFFSYIQKTLAGYPQRSVGYIVPILAGGCVALYIRILSERLQQHELETDAEVKQEKPLFIIIVYYAACLVSGGIVLSVLSATPMVLAGYALKASGFVAPVLFGGASGIILGSYIHRTRQLAAQQILANARLQQERSRIYAILTSIDDGLVVTDENLNIELANNTAVTLLEISANEMHGKPLAQMFDSCTNDSTEDFFSVGAEGGGGRTFRLLTADGSTRVVKAKIAAVHNKNIRTGAVVLILHDETDEYKLEQLKDEFLSTATHNLKTPITAISGYSELLLAQEQLPAEQQHEFLTYIYDKAWHLDHMIDHLLALRRIENGRDLRLHKEYHSIDEIMQSVRRICHDMPARVSFKFDIEHLETSLYVDVKKIYQTLENIIDNAVKFSPENGIVRISGSRQGDRYVFRIQDEGVGMSEEELNHIFDRFYRAETDGHVASGIGLGMSLVKQIITAHGGDIEATSKPHQGSTITFGLPLSQGA
ncbi:MAG: ATP-binding protein [Desulfuromonadaceae bacterium]|nr:ATP-binding protein [Desulfuromonadaceae bacterium]